MSRRPLRGRDAAGRPVPLDSPAAVEPVPEIDRSPQDTLVLARELLAAGRPFYAHDVLEGTWKLAPPADRPLWKALAQLCVGLTHEQRGNLVGAVRLLRRGASGLSDHLGRPGARAYGVPTDALVAAALERAERLEDGGVPGRPLVL